MPELPEVETIRRDLQNSVLGKKIIEACIHVPVVIRQPSATSFKKGVEGRTVEKVLRRGKLLILELSGGKSLTVHLKMTGQLVLRQTAGTGPERAKRAEGLIYPSQGKASRVSLRFSDGSYLDFFDQRLFGELRLLDDWRELAFVKGMGPEPQQLSVSEFKRMLGEKKTKIKPLLMDQEFISGIGNLYAAESLFRARIDPRRPANSLTDKEKELLYNEILLTLEEAIKAGGSSVDDYVRVSGRQGNYARFHKVYGREGKPCLVCKTMIKRIALGGRGTYFCPKCQK